jgi:ATP synthase protein I
MKDIKDLGKKLEKFIPKDKKEVTKNTSSLGIAMRLSSELVAAVFVASVIGYYLDKWLETKPFLLIVFFFLGAVTGILNVVRTSKMINKD